MGKKIKQVLPTIIILIFNVKNNRPQTIAQPRSQGREERTLGTRLTIAHQKRTTQNLNDGKKIFMPQEIVDSRFLVYNFNNRFMNCKFK